MKSLRASAIAKRAACAARKTAGSRLGLAVASLFLSAAVCCAEGPVPAVVGRGIVEYNSRLWQSDEGLPQSGVQAVAQTTDGYLWVGTTRGLTRFDGNQFKLFDNYTPDGLKSSFIAVLCSGQDGSLWIGTAGGGLTQFKGGVFKFIPLGQTERINSIKCILNSRDGSIWVGTLGGLFRIKDGRVTHLTVADGLLDDMVRAMCEVGDELWIGTSAGINVWKNGQLSSVIPCQGKLVRALVHDRNGTVWAGYQGGLAMINNGTVKIFTQAEGLPDDNVAALCVDQRGALWIGTYGGLARWVEGQMRVEQDNQNHFYDQVNSIFEDQEGDVWLGCRDGLQELCAKHFTVYSRQNGLSHNNVISVMEDASGIIWAGTWGGGLNRLENGRAKSWNENHTNTHDPATDLVLALGEGKDGTLLIGTDYEGGVFRQENGELLPWGAKEKAMTNLVTRVIYRDREKKVWFGTARGLVMTDNSERFLENSVIRCILEDRAGNLWVGTTTGLFRRTNGKFTKWKSEGATLNDPITALYEDDQRNLWVGTEHLGLYRCKGGRFTHYNSRNGLLSNEIFEILEDDDGWLWMSCSKGIFRVRKQDLDSVDQTKAITVRCITYGKADGLESVQCSGVAKPGAWKSKDGRLWFATTKGLVVTDPKLGLGSNDLPPKIHIEEIIGDQHRSVLSEVPGTGPRGSRSTVFTLPPGSGNLEVHYAALSFPAPQKIRFKYKLDGIDADWVEAPRRVAYYNHLPAGRYIFRVIACNNEGVWNKTGASVQVVLEPHYWQQWWFKTLVGVVLALVLAGVVWFFIRRKLRRELYLLEQERAIEHERTRIARDMHDEIGAKLTKISFLGAAAKRKLSMPDEAGAQIEKMSVTARDVIRSLDEIVWALNPANDSLEDLANYLSRNATEFFDNSPIACHLDIPEELPALKLGMDVRHNVILAAKEALNNVLKHSEATEVTLQISLESGMFVVKIGDNGRGFNLKPEGTAHASGSNGSATPARGGNGLANMRHRLESVGGQCQVESTAGSGTQIRFSIALSGKPTESHGHSNGAIHKSTPLKK